MLSHTARPVSFCPLTHDPEGEIPQNAFLVNFRISDDPPVIGLVRKRQAMRPASSRSITRYAVATGRTSICRNPSRMAGATRFQGDMERRGRPIGSPEVDWFEAERQLDTQA